MKKFLLLLLSILIVLSMVACSTEKDNTNTESKNDITSSVENEKSTEEDNNPLIISDTIPDGSTYYHNNSWEQAREIYDFNLGEKLTGGQQMPELSTGDIFIHNNIMYIYNAEIKDDKLTFVKNEEMNGWSVRCYARGKTTEINVLSHIQGKPVLSMAYAFASEELSENFNKVIIPETVTNISHLLDYCQVKNDVVFEINSQPTSFEKCFRFKNPEIDMESMKNGDGIVWYSNFVFTVTGNCIGEIKNNIAKETGDIKMTVEVK